MRETDLNAYMRHQSTNDKIVSADAHLAMALKAMPFELKDTAMPSRLRNAKVGDTNISDEEERDFMKRQRENNKSA